MFSNGVLQRQGLTFNRILTAISERKLYNVSNKQYNARDFCLLLKDNGWHYVRQTGDHLIYYKGGKHISFPLRHLNRMMVKRLIKENGLKER